MAIGHAYRKLIPLTCLTMLTFGASGGGDCGTSKYVHCEDEETLVTLLTSIVTLGLHMPNKCRKTSKNIQKHQKTSKNIEEHIIQPQHVFACANSTSSTGVDFAAGGAAFVEASPSVNTPTATQNHLQLLWDVLGTNSRVPFRLQVP